MQLFLALLPLIGCLPKLEDIALSDTGVTVDGAEDTGTGATSGGGGGGDTSGGDTGGGGGGDTSGGDDSGTGTTGADADGDGFISAADGGDDCDDGNGVINPGASEVCDGIDNDCDDLVDDEDSSLDLVTATVWFSDGDSDGYGDSAETTPACEQPEGYVLLSGDCDDGDANINPDADEICNLVDDNCDGATDEDSAVDALTWYRDSDFDDFGSNAITRDACEQPKGYADNADDCDDARAEINPDAEEVCDGEDNNCDGDVDSDATDRATWHPDADNDGYGDPAVSLLSCEAPAGWTDDDQDCDDSSGIINPAEPEICDELDQDCDGSVDEDASDAATWYLDGDLDDWGGADVLTACAVPEGYVGLDGDCDDADADVNPGATEICDDGLDNDCDGGAAGCGPSGSVSAVDADVILYGADANDKAGGAVAAAGDVNGDGYDDLLVGVSEQTVTAATSGAAYIVYGPITGALTLDTTTAAQLGGEGENDKVGQVVLGAGDIDGDGYDDVLVGSSEVDSTGGDSAGAAYLFSGSATAGVGGVLLADATSRLYGSAKDDHAASALASAALSDDDWLDVLVGVPDRDNANDNSGGAYLIHGPITGDLDLEVDADALLEGVNRDDHAGGGVAAGDVNGDGFADAVVGATDEDSGGSNAGAVFVVLGPITSDLSLADADGLITGGNNNDKLGEAIAVADSDGDGVAELLLGAEDYDVPGYNNGGMVYLIAYVSGTADVSSATVKIEGSYTDARLGVSVAFAGDLDRDGQQELLLGAKGADEGGDKAGAAYLFYGSVSGSFDAYTDADLLLTGGAAGDELGTSVAGAGDIDGDGFDDIVAGAPKEDTTADSAGAAYLLLGAGF